MTEAPPKSKDVADFKFKLLCRLKAFDPSNGLNLESPVHLAAAACKYGLIFIGTPSGVQCIGTESIFSIQKEKPNNRNNIHSYPRRDLNLGTQPSHIDVSCDSELLAVTLISQQCVLLQVYSVTSFGTIEVKAMFEVRLSITPGVTVSDLQWNPGIANMLAAVTSDGCAIVIEFKDGSYSINHIPQNAQASCLCWSPKGKQVVVGAKNGSLTQYKPELKAVKNLAPPHLPSGRPPGVLSVHWLSNFQFVAVYKDLTDPNSRPNLIVVNAPKNGPVTFINYDEFCYGSLTSRPEHYFIHQQTWNILMVGTTNGMEVSVLGQEGDSWVEWLQDEASRAALPLTDSHQDVYSIGMALDTSACHPCLIGDKQVDPMPLLLLLSSDGVLCLFHAINLLPGAARLSTPAQSLPNQSGLHLFTSPQEEIVPNSASPKKIEDRSKQEPIVSKSGAGDQDSNRTTDSQVGLQGGQQMTTSQSPFILAQPQFSKPQTQFSLPQPQFGTSQQQFSMPQTPQFAIPQQQSSLPQPQQSQSSKPQAQFNLSQPQQLSTTQSQSSKPQTQFNLSQSQQPSTTQSQSSKPQAQFNLSQPQQFSLPQQQSNKSQPQQPFNTSQQSFSMAQQQFSGAQPFSKTDSTSSFSLSTVGAQASAFTTPASSAGSAIASTVSQSQPSQSVASSLSKPQVQQESKTTTIAPQNEPQQPPQKVVPEPPEDKEAVIAEYKKLCQDELTAFVNEMTAKQRLIQNIDITISSEDSKGSLVIEIDNLQKFEKELTDTTSAHQSEVNALTSSLIEIFGWLENIKAKEKMIKNPSYLELIESQELDPVTKKHLKSIDQHLYYLETQIKQANVHLDSLWDNQSVNSSIKSSLDIPTMEAIYQAIVAQNNILLAKKNLVTSIENRLPIVRPGIKIRKPAPYGIYPPRNYRQSMSDLELSTLAEKLLQSKVRDDTFCDPNLRETAKKYIALANATKGISDHKANILHQWHKNHKVIKTKVLREARLDIDQLQTGGRSAFSPHRDGTPKKSSLAQPRKSLFTISSPVREDTAQDKLDLTLTSLRATSDPNWQNNKDVGLERKEGPNKMDNFYKTEVPSFTSVLQTPFNNPMQNLVAKENENIPTPASFKKDSVPQTEAAVTWGSGLPSFSSVAAKPTEFPNATLFGQSINSKSATKPILVDKANISPATTSDSSPGAVSFSFPAPTVSGSPSPFSFSTPVTSGKATTSSSLAIKTTAISSTTSALTFSSSSSFSAVPSTTVPNQIVVSSSSSTSVVVPPETPVAQSTQPFGKPLFENVSFGSSSPTLFAATSTTAVDVVATSASANSVVSKNSTTQRPTGTDSPFFGTTTTTSISNSTSVLGSSTTASSMKTSSFFGSITSATTSPSIFKAPASSTSTVSTSISASTTKSSSFFGITSTTSSAAPVTSSFTFGFATSSATNTPIFGTSSGTQATTASTFGASPSASTIGAGVIFGAARSATVTAGSVFVATPTTAAVTMASMFGATPVITIVSSGSMFGATPTTTTVSTGSIFGATPTTTITTGSIFGATPTTTVTTGSIFGTTPITTTVTTGSIPETKSITTTSSIFRTNSTASTTAAAPIFGAATTGGTTTSIISSTSTPSTVVVSSTATSSTSTLVTTSVLSTTTSTTSTSTSLFGSSTSSSATPSFFGTTTTSTTASSLFGSTPAVPTASTASVFLAPTTTSAESNSLFGAPNTSAPVFGLTGGTSSSSVFATAAPTTTSSWTSVFGSSVTVTTSAPPAFAGAPTTTAPFGSMTGSVFGSDTSAAPSVFGSAIPKTTGNSVFGGTSGGSFFGGSSTTFGQPTTTTSTTTFGSTAAPNNSVSVFGTVSALSSTSFFGSPTTTTSSFGTPSASSIFGGGGSSTFGAVPTTSSSFFVCSPASSASNVFGSTTNVFGQVASSTSAHSSFGGNANIPQKNLFGQFGQSSPSGGNFGSSGGSLFGPGASFRSSGQQPANIFQSQGSGSIILGGGSGGGGPFSAGSQTVGQTGFGAPPAFQSPPQNSTTFGAGSSPMFGSPATFGSPPSFGGSPSFGSPNKVFGSPVPGPSTFGTATQQSSTFENLASSQNTLTFGNLAQSQPSTFGSSPSFGSAQAQPAAPQPQQPQPFPNTSFGGSSFSTWR